MKRTRSEFQSNNKKNTNAPVEKKLKILHDNVTLWLNQYNGIQVAMSIRKIDSDKWEHCSLHKLNTTFQNNYKTMVNKFTVLAQVGCFYRVELKNNSGRTLLFEGSVDGKQMFLDGFANNRIGIGRNQERNVTGFLNGNNIFPFFYKEMESEQNEQSCDEYIPNENIVSELGSIKLQLYNAFVTRKVEQVTKPEIYFSKSLPSLNEDLKSTVGTVTNGMIPVRNNSSGITCGCTFSVEKVPYYSIHIDYMDPISFQKNMSSNKIMLSSLTDGERSYLLGVSQNT
jgi:hypothetical protein